MQRLNAAMLSRHISSIAGGGQRIGDHHSTSNVQDHDLPIEAADAKLVIEWRKQGIVELGGVRTPDVSKDLPLEVQQIIDEWATCDAPPLAPSGSSKPPSKLDALKKDSHGLLIPRSSTANVQSTIHAASLGNRSKRSAARPKTRASKRIQTEAPSAKSKGTRPGKKRQAPVGKSTSCNTDGAVGENIASTSPSLQPDNDAYPTPSHLGSDSLATEDEGTTDMVGDYGDGIANTSGRDYTKQHVPSELDACRSPVDTRASPAETQQPHPLTSGKVPKLRLGRTSSSLFVTLSEQSSPSSPEEANDDAMPFRGSVAGERETVSLTPGPNHCGSCTPTGTETDTVWTSGRAQTAENPYAGSRAEIPDLLCSPPSPTDRVFHVPVDHVTAHNSFIEGDGERRSTPEDAIGQATFFNDEYEATVAGKSPKLFSGNCPDCSGSCTLGRAPERWTEPDLQLLHSRLREARQMINDAISLPDSQVAAWIDNLAGANIFFEPFVPYSCDRAQADVVCLIGDASSIGLVGLKSAFDKPTIVRPPGADRSPGNGDQCSGFHRITETHVCLAGNIWLRSLRGTHLCMVPPSAALTEGSVTAFEPRKGSRAFFLGQEDVLLIPIDTPSAVFTFEGSLLQAGVVCDGACAEQLTADRLLAGLRNIWAMPSSLVNS